MWIVNKSWHFFLFCFIGSITHSNRYFFIYLIR